ncbi:hypothetical protein RCG17_19840 [Neobacillus sp. PS3-12]|uniref:hypothetical protein n=1 Tax=Neobacillus sp. PS3-12 TaxID=3070677 RepID=UPI0027DEF29D|nr:hypothetical protein [Neobacillus sp. PS3-12]WML51668.1 hypothetical protein RCG17_19840 [Neobacillus sp. PS3-12]
MKKLTNLIHDAINRILYTQTVYLYNFGSQEFNTLITLKLTSGNNVQEELDEFINYFQRNYDINNLKYIAVLDLNTAYTEENSYYIHLSTNISRDKANYTIEKDNDLFAINIIPTFQMPNVFFRIWANSVKNSNDMKSILFGMNLEYPANHELSFV